ncbi:hypothetical protein R3P38DRAFT_3291474 [Favolaschia claudopus]|uniref:Uncharacterized protein n=1 Tax=Favolaschia claudopus TaxID=2862362 RepID=A0AAV9ZPA9_9AGAR
MSLAAHCHDPNINIIPIAVFFDENSSPVINLANACSGPAFPNTGLLDCSFMSSAIAECQRQGIILTLSLGGDSLAGFSSEDQVKNLQTLSGTFFLAESLPRAPLDLQFLTGESLSLDCVFA